MTVYPNFSAAIDNITHQMLQHSVKIHRGKWQGISVAKKPDAATFELHHVNLTVPLSIHDLEHFRQEIKPNLPWADDHFMERIGGHPLNPGTEWRNWPWGQSADRSRIDPVTVDDPGPDRIFDHTYAQRYWPKLAGKYSGGIIPKERLPWSPMKGIYFKYGDLDDVVQELIEDPTTRQAILPVFFPEDTGHRPGRRKPCSLFYHFMLVHNQLDISYQLRSCDLTHHFRDDIYLTVRLLLWMLEQLKIRDPGPWGPIISGNLVMQISNLHCFVNDYIQLTREAA